ncbi:hypothetical protein E6C69_01475 [Salmonella enterica subsp. enterica serovar Typhimurium]|uniref:Uncharacterized protein n=1 Tax=Salmonella enterica subsp. enterica serovar Tudu TaxID=2021402 RepID=A0A5H7CS93_SALET|nr:hypothetical protein ELZ80_11890 [Salmonella enterica subsp. enterica serovar Mikawasima]AZT68367.1 hypothetical protein ELZ68_11645 [Salmonella enterica subsp. enterica serovar Stanleyville]EAB7075139.1 hypothetical protein [Salmonella enterica subsp. enterica serovar Tudu]OKK32339.1 hypothetical protein BST87_11055 [Salmonella enterica subsp. enterica serovar Typhi]RFT59383.1 hypothetical protein DWG17_21920 [Salmonella enterica subsp. enterica serovar Senftenberg]THC82462.1 hypothetical 
MNGDNPSQSRPLAASLRKGRFCLDGRQKKTAGSPAVNACMDRFVFCLYATGQILARITDR